MLINFISIRFKFFSCLILFLQLFQFPFQQLTGDGDSVPSFGLEVFECCSTFISSTIQIEKRTKNTSKVDAEVRSSAATHQSNEWNYE